MSRSRYSSLIIRHPSPLPPWQRCFRLALLCFLDESGPVFLGVAPALQGSPADVQMAKHEGPPDMAGLHLFWLQVENVEVQFSRVSRRFEL